MFKQRLSLLMHFQHCKVVVDDPRLYRVSTDCSALVKASLCAMSLTISVSWAVIWQAEKSLPSTGILPH